ncbi:hypothetical protein D515_00242 [Grimontia indica]|uniref:Uncharacterized protein n=1 Tax=Grimontia indica TaxID=1056512 RepID=R1IT16_9GAMM|nr:hypothetical protein D515_00242 [Grimontia indica]
MLTIKDIERSAGETRKILDSQIMRMFWIQLEDCRSGEAVHHVTSKKKPRINGAVLLTLYRLNSNLKA